MGEKNVNVSRRAFLSRASLGVVIAGAAAAVPGLGAVVRLPAAPTTTRDLPLVAEPLVAHVRDLASGEVSLMVGTDHVVLRDANLAARLYGAALARPRARYSCPPTAKRPRSPRTPSPTAPTSTHSAAPTVLAAAP